ncbi:MAG: tyrosine-type recombinase/integrase [Bacteroidales bacterium]|nr:tyrosine-type recombinase/integrase [Bacteroidales bacterium]
MTIRFIIKGKLPLNRKRNHHYRVPSDRVCLYVRIRDGKQIDWTSRTGILVYPAWWNRLREEVSPHSACPENERQTINLAVEELRNKLVSCYISDKIHGRLYAHWLKNQMSAFKVGSQSKDIENLLERFASERNLTSAKHAQYKVAICAIERFANRTKGERGGGKIDISLLEAFNDESISVFSDFLLTEHLISDGKRRPRSLNTVNDMLKRIRAFARWCTANGYLRQTAFLRHKIGQDVYGTPVSLTSAEVIEIMKHQFHSSRLNMQRDIFVFQCNVGCRAGDLMRLTMENFDNGCVSYIPSKSLKTNPRTIIVPLNSLAKTALDRHREQMAITGKPFTFTSLQQYNRDIKRILREAGIKRNVMILDPLTRTEKKVAICCVASSHIARRTFINNIYRQVRDPELISSLTGHTEGSRAFSRYRAIDNGIKRNLVKLLEK